MKGRQQLQHPSPREAQRKQALWVTHLVSVVLWSSPGWDALVFGKYVR
ncbi:MAG: hypothetical protein QXX56_03735 [Candidatus Bathyarchaeia archaeon]